MFFIFGTFLILLNSYIKRLLSAGFNMGAVGNSLMKSHSCQNVVMHIIINEDSNSTGELFYLV